MALIFILKYLGNNQMAGSTVDRDQCLVALEVFIICVQICELEEIGLGLSYLLA